MAKAKNSAENKSTQTETLKKINLSNINFSDFAPKSANGINKNVGSYRYYENEIPNNGTRSKFRKKMQNLIDNFLFFISEYQTTENEINLKNVENSIKEFLIEYKHRYLINDFSIESLFKSNATPLTLQRAKLMLNFIKDNNYQSMKID